ncbi:hypothetical protein CCP4SC76_2610002 [Gammaproteobacteria bacterium]
MTLSDMGSNEPMDQPGLLIVEDDPVFGETLALEFSERGYLPLQADTLSSAREQPQNNLFRFAIVALIIVSSGFIISLSNFLVILATDHLNMRTNQSVSY